MLLSLIPPIATRPASDASPSSAPSKTASIKAIRRGFLWGKVGQKPVQKYLTSGRAVVLFSLGTGGIRNNRRPLDNEERRDYADRCSVHWHRVCVYPDRLGNQALRHVKSILYVEGNLETKVFTDQVTGLVRQLREIAIRRDGRLLLGITVTQLLNQRSLKMWVITEKHDLDSPLQMAGKMEIATQVCIPELTCLLADAFVLGLTVSENCHPYLVPKIISQTLIWSSYSIQIVLCKIVIFTSVLTSILDPFQALVANQMIYSSEKIKDAIDASMILKRPSSC